MFVFHAAEKQLMPNPEEYSFPPFFDFLGGLLCGGAGGVVFAGTFALMLAVSPLSTRIPSLPQQEIEAVAGRVIETLTWTVDRLSFQADTAKKIAHLKELYYKEPGTEEEEPENAGESDSGKAESEESAKAPEKAAEASAQTETGNDAPAREVGNSRDLRNRFAEQHQPQTGSDSKIPAETQKGTLSFSVAPVIFPHGQVSSETRR